ncbi:ABC transporter permease [Peribacillus saganii]|uniref:ABC transporter permease n=1 Tax=Peribacillus saganii TaxID=2303992 RepID=A0A372LL31_9BACI|nr:ABC transporter permease [Peribacillus saganii]RFU67507.1 ABC transporter permease [Peribacillus saganii]
MEAVERNAKLVMLKNDLKKEQRNLFVRRFISNKLAVTGLIIISILTFLVTIGPLITSYGPNEMVVDERLEGPSSAHWLGTDNLGRDLFTRIVFGAQLSMGVGLSVAVITSILGIVIGLYASYYRVLDNVLMRICDGLMSLPGILLAIALLAALGPSTKNVIIALSVVYTPNVARVVRSAALVVREETYIEAMKSQGASSLRIIWGHIAPNTLSPLIVQSTFIFANAIIVEAALSFLGAGVPPPDPSLGNILFDGKLVIFTAWWMVLFPGICIILSVLGLNLFGDGLRDILDPHSN